MSGTIEEVNKVLDEQPGLLNKSPEDEGMASVTFLDQPTNE